MAWALVGAGLVASCKEKEHPPPQRNSAGGDDDFVVVEPVPMNLLDPSFLARYRDALAQGLAGGEGAPCGEGAGQSREGMGSLDPGLDDAAIARDIAAAPCRAAQGMNRLNAALQDYFAKLFAASGAFRGQDVKVGVRRGQETGSRIFRLPEGMPGGVAWAEVAVTTAATPTPYTITLYAKAGDATEASTIIAFGKSGDGGGTEVKASVAHREAAQGAFAEQRLLAQWDSAARSLSATFGDTVAAAGKPSKNHVAMVSDGEGKVTVQGGYRWDVPEPSLPDNALLPPRYALLHPGDVEVFAARGHGAAPGEMVQKLAFLRSEEVAQDGAAVLAAGNGVFTDFTYPALMSEHVGDVVRTPGVNGACATYGDYVRGLFGAQTTPAVVANAPADFCAANVGFTDARLWDVLKATCDAGKSPAVTLNLASGGTASYPLCPRLAAAALLTNPQFFTAAANGGRERTQAPTARHQSFLQELGTKALPDLRVLATPGWAPLKTRPRADFDAAEALP